MSMFCAENCTCRYVVQEVVTFAKYCIKVDLSVLPSLANIFVENGWQFVFIIYF